MIQSCDLRTSHQYKPTVGHILGNPLDDLTSSQGRKTLYKKHKPQTKSHYETNSDI